MSAGAPTNDPRQLTSQPYEHSPVDLEIEGHRMLARGHELLALAARARGGEPPHANRLLPVAVAARHAATSARVIREAIRAGELPAYGGQRDRSVLVEDLERWITSRRVTLPGPADRDIERRVRRMERRRTSPAE